MFTKLQCDLKALLQILFMNIVKTITKKGVCGLYKKGRAIPRLLNGGAFQQPVT